MDLANGTHDYHLKRPITVYFAGKGDQEVTLIEMREPSRAHVKKSAKIKQMVMQSIIEMSKDTDNNQAGTEIEKIENVSDEDHEENSKEMLDGLRVALLLSKTVDLGDFIECFVDMALKNAKKPIIMCDGEVPIKDIHFDQMSVDEIEEMALTYASFFHMPSEMQSK